MNADNRNLILAVTLSMIILVVWQMYFAPPPELPAENASSTQQQSVTAATGLPQTAGQAATTTTENSGTIDAGVVMIEDQRVSGSISLAGGRIADLRLSDYAATTHDDPQRVRLLRPADTADGYHAEILFLDGMGNRLVPKDAVWQADGDTLDRQRSVLLSWQDGEGLEYSLRYVLEADYTIAVTAAVRNIGTAPKMVRHFARLRRDLPSRSDFFISYEGPIGVFAEDQKTEVSYDTIQELGSAGETHRSSGVRGWIGITDKYWLTALIPQTQDDTVFGFRRPAGAGEPTQVDIDTAAVSLNNGEEQARLFHLFAGPKKLDLLLETNAKLGVERLDHAIDWGWFPFLTKPFFHALNWLFLQLGNFGLAILALTVGVKLAFFPLANKSYHSMAKMRELAPKIQEMRERFSDDRQRQQQEMMQLYRNEKVNPAAGCLPILVQIPVFFALYKVLFVTIEMRHAPFYGWIKDLSALDPTSILNLFGLLPYSTTWAPDVINLGVWPILMGITMFVQMQLNPPPPDPVQAKVFKFMPLFFTFLLATFPAGLVIYWTWNNLLSILQQWYIMRSYKRSLAKNS